MSWIDRWVRMPGPEFVSPPDPPEGYAILTDYDADLHPLAKQLDSGSRCWRHHWTKLRYTKSEIYAVPVKPPLPDPPDGYEILTDYGALPDPRAMFWSRQGQWMERAGMNKDRAYDQDSIYAVPIAPPKPQYRPFRNADEFRPYRERWFRVRESAATEHPPRCFDRDGYGTWSWNCAFERLEFEDGTPFGMPVES